MATVRVEFSILALLALTTATSAQDATAPAPTPNAPSKSIKFDEPLGAPLDQEAKQKSAGPYEYQGTTARISKHLDADPKVVEQVQTLLAEDDFVPALRAKRFSKRPARFYIVGWHVTIEKLQVRDADTLVTVRTAPRFKSPDGGIIGVMSDHTERYRLVDGELHFIDSDPLPEDLSFTFAVM